MNKTFEVSVRQRNFIMLIIVIFIFADIVCENFIGIIFDKQSIAKQIFLFWGFILLQILFAPIQSSLSDVYGRKKSLIVTLSFSFLSLVFLWIFSQNMLFFPLLILTTLSKGALGNTLPISLAVMSDIQDKNYRLSFAFSTAAYAFAYLILATVKDSVSDNQINVFLLLLFGLLIVICMKFIHTKRDEEANDIRLNETVKLPVILRNEISLIGKDLKDPPTRKALSAFFLWETSLYCILLTQVDFQINKDTHIAQLMMCGYLLGVFILFLLQRAKDKTIIKMGYFISFLSLIPYFILYKLVENVNILIGICYFFHALGNAFLSPALLSILAKERKVHERGRIYGLTDSIDTCGYLCAAVIIIAYKAVNMDLIFLVLISFILFTLSWLFFNRFKNVKV